MNLNFREALSLLARALPMLLLRGALYMAAGFTTILLFAALAFASHIQGGLPAIVVALVPPLILVDALFTVWVLERFVVHRHQAAMLHLFSRPGAAFPGAADALREAALFFPGSVEWATANRRVRVFFAMVHRGREEFPLAPGEQGRAVGLLASGPLSRAVLALAFSRFQGDPGRAVREAVALCLRNGAESRAAARRWLGFSAAALAVIFVAFALPSAYLFGIAGAPVWIAVALAAAMAWILHQALIAPLVLAGVSATLLNEARGRLPDPGLCDRLAALFPGSAAAR